MCEFNGAGNITAINDFGPDGVWARHVPTDQWLYTFDPQGGLAEKVSAFEAISQASGKSRAH